MINKTLSSIAISNASNRVITPSTTIIIEISMIDVTTPSMIINAGINSCRTAVATINVVVTITTTTMIAINTIVIIITGTRLLLLLVLTFS